MSLSGYSKERELSERREASRKPDDAPVLIESDIADALADLEEAESSRDMAMAIRRPAYRRILTLMNEGKVGAGDLIRIMNMTDDRIDGKVADKMVVSQNVTIEQRLGEDDKAILERWLSQRQIGVDTVSVDVVEIDDND